jgi:hypothetical protein
MWVTHTEAVMRHRTTRETVVEHVVETDERGNQRIGARRVVDAGLPVVPERATESPDERTRVSGR